MPNWFEKLALPASKLDILRIIESYEIARISAVQPYEHVIKNFIREIKLQSTEMENLAIAVKRY